MRVVRKQAQGDQQTEGDAKKPVNSLNRRFSVGVNKRTHFSLRRIAVKSSPSGAGAIVRVRGGGTQTTGQLYLREFDTQRKA